MKKLVVLSLLLAVLSQMLCGCGNASPKVESEPLSQTVVSSEAVAALESETETSFLDSSIESENENEKENSSVAANSQTESVETTVEDTQSEGEETLGEIKEPHKYTEMELKVFELINLEREKAGEAPLALSEAFYPCAEIRTKEADVLWDHTRPNGQKYYTVYEECDIDEKCLLIGENLGRKFKTAETIVEALMNSEGHRKNILHSRFNGVAICIMPMSENPEYYVMAQIFVET